MIGKMKLSFLLLGLGIGILLTNFIYYINPKVEYKELKNEEIIERAKDLGMVFVKDTIELENHVEDKNLPSEEDYIEENNIEEDERLHLEEDYTRVDNMKVEKKSLPEKAYVKADNIEEKKRSSSTEAQDKGDAMEEDNNLPLENDPIEEDNTGENEIPSSEEINTEESNEKSQDIIVFRITKGQSLTAIAKNLYSAGVIDNVNGFVNYSKEKGKAPFFQVGTYNLAVGMDYETLVNILTKKDS